VRVIGVELDEENRALIRRKLGMKPGKFVASIERVTVRVTDMNGPRSGVDRVCNLKVVLSGLPSVVVDRRHVAPHAAIDLALRAAEQSIRRRVGRRRMKPLRRGTINRPSATITVVRRSHQQAVSTITDSGARGTVTVMRAPAPNPAL
jgi:hypothetical protein